MIASRLRDGDTIDLHPVVVRYDDFENVEYHPSQYEYAMVDGDPAPAEAVDGREAVLLCTDLGNYKVPANFEVEVITA